ncbi:MAG: sigma-70 family RNA polymerase sigma factor [Verrucomicrobia bacterium]|nr:sigma-70 family RNA polymerase sigma factor [Verrucomicrobiota bacterium]
MSTNREDSTSGENRPQHFATTHWSVVLTAGQEETHKSADAMEQLCRGYWYPLYAFVRRLGHAPHDAQDLTQGFFAHLLETNLVGKAQREKGKFRSFLLASLKNFIASERDRAQACKRGGGWILVSLDEHAAEHRLTSELKQGLDPETLYERTWALTVLEQALNLLEQDYVAAGKGPAFHQLQVFLLGEKVPLTYSAVAEGLGTSEGAVKMLVQRLRQRFRECLRTVVANTVATSSEIDEELRHLVQVLGN